MAFLHLLLSSKESMPLPYLAGGQGLYKNISSGFFPVKGASIFSFSRSSSRWFHYDHCPPPLPQRAASASGVSKACRVVP